MTFLGVGANGSLPVVAAVASAAHASLALGRSPPTGSQVSVRVLGCDVCESRTVMVSRVFPACPGPGEADDPGAVVAGPLGLTVASSFPLPQPPSMRAAAMPGMATAAGPSLVRDCLMTIRLRTSARGSVKL